MMAFIIPVMEDRRNSSVNPLSGINPTTHRTRRRLSTIRIYPFDSLKKIDNSLTACDG